MSYLLDTDICIYILNENPLPLRTHFEEKLASEIHVSTLTEAELHYGAAHSSRPQKNRERIEAFLQPLQKLSFESDDAREFAKIKEELVKKGKPIGTIDMLIAATARARGLILATNNTKHFSPISNLKIENWIG